MFFRSRELINFSSEFSELRHENPGELPIVVSTWGSGVYTGQKGQKIRYTNSMKPAMMNLATTPAR